MTAEDRILLNHYRRLARLAMEEIENGADALAAVSDPEALQRARVAFVTAIQGIARLMTVPPERDRPGSGRRDRLVRLRLTEEERFHLNANAEELGLSLSDYIRRMCGI